MWAAQRGFARGGIGGRQRRKRGGDGGGGGKEGSRRKSLERLQRQQVHLPTVQVSYLLYLL